MSAEAATEQSNDGTTGSDGETELGVDANVLAALAYIFNLIGALILLVLEDDEYVRFHAAQALLVTAVVIAARFVVRVLGAVFGVVGLDVLTFLLGTVVWAGAAIAFLFLAYKGFTGERFEVPVLAEYIDDVEGAF